MLWQEEYRFDGEDLEPEAKRTIPIPAAVLAPAPLTQSQRASCSSLIKLGCNAWESEFCVRRSISDPTTFLAPVDKLTLNATLPDLDKQIDLVRKARSLASSVAIFGDYDVDGIMSSTILLETLTRAGLHVTSYVPCRQTEGFGMNDRIIKAAFGDGAKIFFAVDFGSAQVKQVNRIRNLGGDIGIFDHHKVESSELSQPNALSNPYIHGEPKEKLCAAGAVLLFAIRLKEAMPELALPIETMSGQAATATIADMVPLVGDNRIIVKYGLRYLSNHPGMELLLEEAGIPKDNILPQDIAFQIGPMLNAPGRICPHGALDPLSLLQGSTASQVATAQSIIVWNKERKDRTYTDCQLALEIVEKQGLERALCVASEHFDPGVVGLVASFLVERFHRPAFVTAWCEPGGGRGSARGGEKFDVELGLRTQKEHLVRFGGHKPAGGYTIRRTNYEKFHEGIVLEAERQLGEWKRRTVQADFCVPLELLAEKGSDIIEAFKNCEPFGNGNEAPIFYIPNVQIGNIEQIGREHLVVYLGNESAEMKAYLWRGSGHPIEKMRGKTIDVGCRFSRILNRGGGRFRRELALEIVGLGNQQ